MCCVDRLSRQSLANTSFTCAGVRSWTLERTLRLGFFSLKKYVSSKVAKGNIQQAFAIAFAFSGCFKDAFSQGRLEHCSLPLTREAAPSFVQDFPQGADGLWIKVDRLFENHNAPFHDCFLAITYLPVRGGDSLTIGWPQFTSS